MFLSISKTMTSCLSTGSLGANIADGEDGDHYWKNQDVSVCDQNKSKSPSGGLSA